MGKLMVFHLFIVIVLLLNFESEIMKYKSQFWNLNSLKSICPIFLGGAITMQLHGYYIIF